MEKHEEKTSIPSIRQTAINSSLKPVLIDNLEVKLLKEDERGKMYILRNPNNMRYIKMHESVLKILNLFDGKNSIKDLAITIKNAKLPIDIHELVTLLAEEGFLKNVDIPQKRGRGDIFSFKIKLFTMTEKHMRLLEKLFFFVKTRGFKLFYIAFCATGFFLFIYNLPQIFTVVINLMSPETSLFPLLLSIILFFVVEFAHEFAHAVSYYYYGGKSSDIGLEFHFLIPFYYTSTPDAVWMETKKQIMIFISGPMTSIFFAEVFTLLFLFEPSFRYIWAAHSFFWHLSALITLTPFIRTDGYFIAQAKTKFPNLLEHGVDTLIKAFQVLIRKASLKEFKEHMSQYSFHEKKILKFYVPLFPIVTGILMFVFVFSILQFGIVNVLSMTPQILSGSIHDTKTQVLWIMYVLSLVFSFVGITGTLNNIFRKLKEK